MESLLTYFAKRPLVANVLMFGCMIVAGLLWDKIGKEEMPEFAMEFVRVSIRFPGASAEDVELFITKPVEERLKSLSGLREVSSTSSYGSSSLSITFEPQSHNIQEKIQDVKDAIAATKLPREAEDPIYRQYRSDEKAIIDIGIYLKNHEILSTLDRRRLQEHVLAFKNKILNLPEISGVDLNGYLVPQLQIKIKPERLDQYELSLEAVKNQVAQKHIRRPLGKLEDKSETEVTLLSELDHPEVLRDLIVSSGFQGQTVKLNQIASIEQGFAKATSVDKVQGREGIILNIKKSVDTDILDSQIEDVGYLRQTTSQIGLDDIGIVLIDDESYDVRNRLQIIANNGLLGFGLLLVVLFVFLDFKSGIWVAMGIPFCLAATLIAAMVFEITINNITLAAIIIVLGIVVDDAIIIAENIVRHKDDHDHLQSAVRATQRVMSPVIASVLTTCAAFVPLYFFSGHFGMFVKWIPPIIFLMLGASLIESFFILPSHMLHRVWLESWFEQLTFFKGLARMRSRAIAAIEGFYERSLRMILHLRIVVMVSFIALLVGAGIIFSHHLKFVMFPREESRDFRLKVTAQEGVSRVEMAGKIRKIEDVFLRSPLVTSVRSRVGQSRRGGQVNDHEASIRVEILPPSERETSLKAMLAGFKSETDAIEGFESIKYQKSRWGADSGSPIVIEVQENNDLSRRAIIDRLKQRLEQHPSLTNVEVERPPQKDEFALTINKAETSRLAVSFDRLATTLRAYLEGEILYTLNKGEEEVDVVFTADDHNKGNLQRLLALKVANNDGYLVPIKGLVTVVAGKKPANISRINFKRTTVVYADIKEGSSDTPLTIAERFEQDQFDQITNGYPSAQLIFRGEVEDSRESQSDFSLSAYLALGLIFILLVFLFDSFWAPLLIGAIIPFSIIGAAMAFFGHGLEQFGFFAVVGTLGMIGVVINDSIVLVDKLRLTPFQGQSKRQRFAHIAQVASTRLRAIVVTTLTTVAGLLPTAYGLGGFDSMLAEMMLAMAWGLAFGMLITLIMVPCLYSFYLDLAQWRHKGVSIIVFILVICAGHARGEPGLSLDAFIEKAKAHDPNFARIAKSQEPIAYHVKLGLPDDATKLTIGSRLGYDPDAHDQTSRLSAGISRELTATGTQLTLTHSKTNRPDRAEDTTDLTIAQPLYRNFWGESTRLLEQALGQEVEVLLLKAKEDEEAYLEQILNQFLDYQKAYQDVQLAKVALKEAQNLYYEVYKKKQKSIATQLDLDRSQLQVLIRKDGVAQRNQAYVIAEQQIAGIIGSQPAPPLLAKGDSWITATATNIAVDQLRQVKILRLKQDRADKDIVLTRNAQEPQMDLIGGLSSDHSQRFTSTVRTNEAFIGLQLDWPLGGELLPAKVHQAIYQRSSFELERDVWIKAWQKDIAVVRSAMINLKVQMKIAQDKTNLAYRIQREEERRYGFGKQELARVIEIKSERTQYQFQSQTLEVEHQKLLVKWLSLNDLLVPSTRD